LIQSPILKVLSTLQKHRVRALLIGGQACILHGASEFSRDVDFAVLASPENLDRLKTGLRELKAESIYVPELSTPMLEKGHACHFRCHARTALGLRVDIMSVMRGVDPFEALWKRGISVRIPGGGAARVMSLPDLVQSKKTQRDRDWLMLRRLVEVDIFNAGSRVTGDRVRFWLRECRTPQLLCRLADTYRRQAGALETLRPLLRCAQEGDALRVEAALAAEEAEERRKDIEYWTPLRRELESLRHARTARIRPKL